MIDDYLETAHVTDTNPYGKKLVIDMADYPFSGYQSVSLQVAEG